MKKILYIAVPIILALAFVGGYFIQKEEEKPQNLLEWAVELTVKDVKKFARTHQDINAPLNEEVNLLLLSAMYSQNPEVVEEVIKQGADVHVRGFRYGESVIMRALYNSNIEILRVLIKNGADINAQTPEGDTALMMAAHNESPEIVMLLLENGADKDIVDGAGQKAIDYAGYNPIMTEDVLKMLE